VGTFDLGGTGSVSITTPSGRPGLTISQSGGANRFGEANSGSFYGFGYNSDWLGFNSNSPTIGIQKGATAGTGRVGIGTSTPDSDTRLHVLGVTRNNLFSSTGSDLGTVAISTPAGRPGITTIGTGGLNRFDGANFGSFYGFGYNSDWLGVNSNAPNNRH